MISKEKKEYILLGVLVLGIIIIFIAQFKGKSKAPDIAKVANQQQSAPTPGQGGTSQAPVSTAQTGTTRFLPLGTDLNLNILDDARFKALVKPVYPTVTKEEIGTENPFNERVAPAQEQKGN